MAEKRKYLLKAGVVIKSPLFEGGKVFTINNMTDDEAKRYLEMFPSQASLFQRLPTDEEKAEEAVGEQPADNAPEAERAEEPKAEKPKKAKKKK